MTGKQRGEGSDLRAELGGDVEDLLHGSVRWTEWCVAEPDVLYGQLGPKPVRLADFYPLPWDLFIVTSSHLTVTGHAPHVSHIIISDSYSLSVI